jgi:SNF2 family DNA or RNA helicase
MQLTDYHSKYFAYELTKRCSSDSLEKLAGAVAGAQVDLNPHQVDAALFAFSSPLSKGALLADEVGLGKTIEAGLVLSQKWAERKRHILVIVPSNLRKQWHQELSEKFFLPCRILEAKPYNAAIRQGHFRPFECDEKDEKIVICSYQFARNKAADVASTPWDLVVMDEAHRLRNVYKPSNVIANTLKLALANMRSALVDYFREEGRIMIATEAGAEGINLQFCSLVVNYDLPWNPQRIEQRIGRCHRYGQKHDVVVVNFLNRKNAADQRVFHLLSEKFQLFEGVFGASDEVLGAIESGVDFEKRINDIYQHCRKHEEIKSAFDQLQLELSLEINESMTVTRKNSWKTSMTRCVRNSRCRMRLQNHS